MFRESDLCARRIDLLPLRERYGDTVVLVHEKRLQGRPKQNMTPITTLESGIVLQQNPQFLQNFVSNIVSFLPAIISAIIVLIIGWIVGRILGGIVERVVDSIGISDYAEGTPLESSGGGGIADALGKLVAYIVYFYAILAAADILGIGILSQLLRQIGAFLPVIFSAVVVLVIGFVVGRIVGDIVAGIVGGFNLDSLIRGTPLEGPVSSVGGIGIVVGKVIEYYIYFFALLAAADILQIPALSRVLNNFAGYIPTLIGALVVLVIGIFVADHVGDIVANTDTGRATDLAGLGVKLFIYYITITIALNTMGFNVAVLTTLFTAVVTAFFGALGLALAIALGIALGWGSKDYVADNIDRWMSRAKSGASDMAEEDTGSDSDFEPPDSDDSGPGGSGPSGTGGSN